MIDLKINPVAFVVIITIIVELILVPFFDWVTERWAGVCNRHILRTRGSGYIRADRSIFAEAKGFFLSLRQLGMVSVLRKIYFMSLIISEIFIDTKIIHTKSVQSGMVFQRFDQFLSPQNVSFLRPGLGDDFLRDVCVTNGIAVETLISFTFERFCGERALFHMVTDFNLPYNFEQGYKNDHIFEYDRPCAIGELQGDGIECQGNFVRSSCPENLTCFREAAFMELINKTSIRFSVEDISLIEGDGFNPDLDFPTRSTDVVNVTFAIPITRDAIKSLIWLLDVSSVQYSLTSMTGSVYNLSKIPENDLYPIPKRDILVFGEPGVITTVRYPFLVLTTLSLVLLLLVVVWALVDHVRLGKPSEEELILSVNTLERLCSFIFRRNRDYADHDRTKNPHLLLTSEIGERIFDDLVS